MMFQLNLKAAVFGAVILAASSARADWVSVDFESFDLGPLPGGNYDTREAGDGRWYVPNNASTYGTVKQPLVVNGIGRDSSRGLEVGNRGNNGNNVITNLRSSRLNVAAGESSLGGVNPLFESSFWFRTASDKKVDGFAFATESWGTGDRNTLLEFGTGASGISVKSTGRKSSEAGDFTTQVLTQELAWGEWYQVFTKILFIDGVDNDVVTFGIYDKNNAQVGSNLVSTTWEYGQRSIGYNGGKIVAVDAIGFQARNGNSVDGAVYIDNVTWGSSQVPEPGSLALVLAAGLAGFAVRRRKA